MSDLAIVFLIFNRPEPTARTFEAIRAARPARLLVVADGPRAGRTGEAELCAATRAVVDAVDWPCDVQKNFSEANMGCGKRVASGLDWAFSLVEEAVILEDDCLADPTFFPYCTELLHRYRDDGRIAMISGNNFQNGVSRTADSYYFSRFPHCWGWATWRRAWRNFDYSMSDWPRRRGTPWLRKMAGNPILESYWTYCFDSVANGRIDTWDYQWLYCVLARGGLCVVPDVNLVTNIGFGDVATHTFTTEKCYVNSAMPIEFPLKHPKLIEPNKAADDFEKLYLHNISEQDFIANGLARIRLRVLRAQPLLERIGLWRPLRAAARFVRRAGQTASSGADSRRG